jgi:hypothetical protein
MRWDDWMISPQARCGEAGAAAAGWLWDISVSGRRMEMEMEMEMMGMEMGRLDFYFVSGYGEVVEMGGRVGMRGFRKKRWV